MSIQWLEAINQLEDHMRSMTAPATAATTGSSILRVVPRAPQPASARQSTPEYAPGALFGALGAIGQPIGIIAANGDVIRQTEALGRLLDDPGERDRIARLARAAVNALVATGGMPQSWKAAPDAVCLREGGWILNASLCGPEGAPPVLIHVARENTSLIPASDEDLRRQYGLTPTELRVSRLLADGESNRKIAASLGISVHTARHHTEHVMRKLGIESRNGVARKLTTPPGQERAGFAIQGS